VEPSPRLRLRAVIFDLFHTLVDPELFRPRDFNRASAIADLFGFPRQEFADYWSSTAGRRNTDCSVSAEELLREFASRNGFDLDPEHVPQAEDHLGRYQAEALLNPSEEVLRALRELKGMGLQLALLSNADSFEIGTWPRSPLAAIIDHAYFSCHIGRGKPDPEAYLHCLRQIGVPAPSAAFVGDGGSGELLGAREAHLRPIIFMRRWVGVNGLRSPEDLERFARQADMTVDRFPQLVRVLAEHAGV